MKKKKVKSLKKQPGFIADMSLAVDPDTFLFMSNIYQAAARLTMPTDNPAARPIFQDKAGKTYSFADIPMNRGMLAVTKQLRELSIEPTQPYLARLMHLGEVLEQREKFAEFFKPSDEDDGSVMVAGPLIMACAVARFDANTDRLGFDLNDVLVHALRFKAEDEAKSAGTSGA